MRDDWSGSLVFVNPPWSNQQKWLERAYDQWSSGKAETIVCLVPAKTDTKLFHEVLTREADIYFIQGRPRFFKEDRSSEATMVSAMLVIFGATNEQKLRFMQCVRGLWWSPPSPSTDRAERSFREKSESMAEQNHAALRTSACASASGAPAW